MTDFTGLSLTHITVRTIHEEATLRCLVAGELDKENAAPAGLVPSPAALARGSLLALFVDHLSKNSGQPLTADTQTQTDVPQREQVRQSICQLPLNVCTEQSIDWKLKVLDDQFMDKVTNERLMP